MLKFSEIKDKIQNLGEFESLKEIKEAGLRVVRRPKTGDYWLIEEEFLKPVIKSPRECKSILIKPEDLKYKVLMVHKSKAELEGKKVLDYIKWGEVKRFNQVPSCKSRPKWWNLGIWSPPYMIWSDAYNDRYASFMVPKGHYADKRFFYIYPKNLQKFTGASLFLNSSIIPLYIEVEGILNLGEGVIYTNVYWLEDIFVFGDNLPVSIERFQNKKIESIFKELGFDPSQPVRSQEPKPLPDRKALDDIVFDALELTEEERKEVYWAVCELVKNRLEKAKSV